MQCKIFDVLPSVIKLINTRQHANRVPQLITIIETIHFVTMAKPQLVTDYLCFRRENAVKFLLELEQCFVHQELGIKFEIIEFFKSVLDPQNDNQELIAKLFFSEILLKLVKDVVAEANKKDGKLQFEFKNMLEIFFDLLIYCLENHLELMRSFIIDNALIQELLSIIEPDDKLIIIYFVRFFKMILLKNDSFLTSFLLEKKLLDKVMDLYYIYSEKTNMVVSSFLSMFQLIHKQNLKKVIIYIGEKQSEEI